MKRCGFCVGYQPNDPEPPGKVEGVTRCPCCGGYCTALYDGECVSKHEGYGTQAEPSDD